MKRLLTVISIALLFTVVASINANAQCKGFAKKMCKIELVPYIHDGNYHADVFSEGEEADMYKTCFAGVEYRLVVCTSDELPAVEFKVYDANKKVIFNNKDHNMTRVFNFKSESSQQIRIWVKVPAGAKKSEGEIKSGCVAIMVGFKDNSGASKEK
jgi:hypothetical protein